MNRYAYAFLTLAKDTRHPAANHWDGQYIYDSMTQADIVTVLTTSQYTWMKTRIEAMQQAVRNNGGKWFWAIGGFTDLT